MSFFEIQNHAVGIKNGEAKMEPVIIGDAARSFSGSPLSTRRAIKRDWSVTTALAPAEDCKFLIALIQGMGHTWDFDATDVNDEYLYSSKGLKPVSVGSVVQNTSNTKFGAGRVQIPASAELHYETGYEDDWTIMGWKGTSGGVYTHYIVNSNGHKWVDGVRNDGASTPFFEIDSDGTLSIGDNTQLVTQYFDDVIVIEEAISDTWAEDFGVMTSAFGAMPKFRVRGDMVLNNIYQVEGYDVSVSYTAGIWEGSWNSDLMEVSFTMHEVTRVS